jgi:DNA repair protein RadC
MKQFITEAKRMQQLAGILNENEETNSNYLDQKERVKNWLELTFDGEEIDPEIESKVNVLLNSNNQMTKNLFKAIWGTYTKKYSTGDVGADWDSFNPTFKWIIDGDESHFDNY